MHRHLQNSAIALTTWSLLRAMLPRQTLHTQKLFLESDFGQGLARILRDFIGLVYIPCATLARCVPFPEIAQHSPGAPDSLPAAGRVSSCWRSFVLSLRGSGWAGAHKRTWALERARHTWAQLLLLSFAKRLLHRLLVGFAFFCEIEVIIV